MTMFDWQVVRHSRGPRDLAYFLSISVSVEQRRTPEESLLGSYYEALKANGVERDIRPETSATTFKQGSWCR